MVVFSSVWYKFTPTIISFPPSIRACFRAAASSMRILGIPVSIALAIPPSDSTSSINSHALFTNSLVNVST